jgi:toxin HigB-1
MRIRNVVHKGLRRFIENDDAAGLPAACTPKIRNIVSFLQDMQHESELKSVPTWKAHQMTGDRKGVWALHVTKNWRITFLVDRQEAELFDLDYGDYH